MSIARNKGLLRYIGLVVLIVGTIIALFDIPQATQYSTDSQLLDTLRYICLGIAIEILGLGLVIADRK